MEKWLILELKEGRYNTSLEHLVMPECKEVLRKHTETHTHSDGDVSEQHGGQPEPSPKSN